MLETCAAMTFPDFRRQMEWCQGYFTKNVPESLHIGCGYDTTQGYVMY